MNAANDKQIGYIKRLLGQKQLDGAHEDRLRNRLEAHEIDVRTPGDGTRISSRDASMIIDWLLGRPWKPRDDERQDGQPAGLGVYRKDDRIYVVREFTPQGESAPVRYARELVDLNRGQADRLNGDGEHVRYEERKAPRMQYRLCDADLMPLEDVRQLSIQYRHCLICGTKLEAAESVERGIGPVCEKRQQRTLVAA